MSGKPIHQKQSVHRARLPSHLGCPESDVFDLGSSCEIGFISEPGFNSKTVKITAPRE